MPWAPQAPGFTPPTADPSAVDPTRPPAPETPGAMRSFLTAGAGAIENVLDAFSRPFRFAGHLAGAAFGAEGASVRQAFEQLDPFNLVTPDTPAATIRGADLLAALGVEEGPELGWGIHTRDVGGFGVEMLLDPLSWFGGQIGRSAAKTLRSAGKPLTGFAEGLAGASATRLVGSDTARGLGRRLAGRLERSGGLLPGVGAAGGAAVGAMESPESPVGGALAGGVIGALGGAAIRHLPTVAERGLRTIGAVSDRFALRGLNDEAFDRLRTIERLSNTVSDPAMQQALALQARAERELAAAAITTTSKYLSFLEKPGGREVAAEGLGRLGELPSTLAGGNVPRAAFEAGQATPAMAQQWDVQLAMAKAAGPVAERAAKAKIAAERTILRLGGRETMAKLREDFARMIPAERQAIERRLFGDEDFPLVPGKIATEAERKAMGVLEATQIDRMIARTKVVHEVHAPGDLTPEQLLADMLGKLDELPGMAGLSVPERLARARSMFSAVTAKGREAAQFRHAVGAIEELNRAYPGLLKDRLTELMTEDVGRLVSQRTAHEMFGQIGRDAEWTRPALDVLRSDEAVRFVQLSTAEIAKLPPGVREHFVDTVTDPATLQAMRRTPGVAHTRDAATSATVPRAMRREIYERVFGRDGVGRRLLDPELPGKFRQSIKAFNRFWGGWTLGPFTSWVGRNVPANMWNNELAGVGFRARARHSGTAWGVMNVVGDLMGGRATAVPKGPLADLAAEILEQRVMTQGVAATQAGQTLMQLMGPRQALRGAAQAIRHPIETLRRVFKVDPQQNLWTRAGFGANAILENHERVLHFVAKRAAGLTPTQAATSVFKALGDFAPGNAVVERAAELMPFIRWSAFNIPRQMRGLFERPGVIARAAGLKLTLDENNGVNVPREIYPEWLQGQLAVPVGKDANGSLRVFALNQWWPLADLTEITSVERFGQFLLRSLTPVLSEPIAQAMNFDSFFRRVIERYPGEQEHLLGMRISKRDAHALRIARVLSEVDRAWGPLLGLTPASERVAEELAAMTRGQAAARALLGVKVRPIDLAAQRRRRLEEAVTDVRRLARQVPTVTPMERPALEHQLRNARARLRFWQGWDPERHPLAPTG